MSVPDGVFIIVVECADCGKELNRSKPLTSREYTQAIITQPLCTARCPNGCRSTASDCNANVRTRWEREDGTFISREQD